MGALGTVEQAQTWLRTQSGHAKNTTLLGTDVDLGSPVNIALAGALEKVNLDYPGYGVGSFETVVDQQDYQIVPPEPDASVLRVFWDVSNGCENSLLSLAQQSPPLHQTVVDPAHDDSLYSGRRFYSASVFYSLLRDATYISRFRPDTYEVLGDSVYLIPVPKKVMDVYYVYEYPKYETVEDIDRPVVSAFRHYALHLIHQILGAGAGAVTSVDSTVGTKITTRAGQHHMQLAERHLQLYQNTRPPLPPVRAWIG